MQAVDDDVMAEQVSVAKERSKAKGKSRAKVVEDDAGKKVTRARTRAR
jgi:hypothetical protein